MEGITLSGNERIRLSGKVSATAPAKPAECVRDNAERALARLTSAKRGLICLRERITGEINPATEEMKDAANAAGFVPGVGYAVDRIHNEITAIDELLSSIGEVI